MTALAQLVWDCKDLGGMDKLVMMGWAEQVPDGWDTAYASKETVAACTRLGTSTVKRHTRELVKRGVLIDTGGRQQWKTGYTPIYQINLEFLTGHPSNLDGGSDWTGGQDDPQGSRFGSRFVSPSQSGAKSDSSSPLPLPQKREGKTETENRKPKTVEPKPKPEPTPTPVAHGHKACPDCGEPLQRDVNHFLDCKVAEGESPLGEYLGDMPPHPKPMEEMEFEDGWEYDGKPLFPRGREAEGAKQRVNTAGQKNAESIGKDKRATPVPHPPIALTPLCPCGGKLDDPDFADLCNACETLRMQQHENTRANFRTYQY